MSGSSNRVAPQGRAVTPPGPSPRELLPRIPEIQKDALGFLLSLSRQYGDLAYFSAGSLPVYIVNHPDGVKHVLQDQNRRYSKDTIQYNALSTITGKGLLTSDGAFWLRQRRLAQPAFARPRLLALDQIVVPAARRMLDRWVKVAQTGQVLDVDGEMMRLALEIVGKALFGIDLSQESDTLTSAVLTALDHIMYRARNVIVPPNFLPTPRNLRFRRALRILDDSVYSMISARQTASEPGDDLLGMFLRARDADTGELMSKEQVRDEVLTMLIAGHETVASALTWTWYLLSSHPEERVMLHNEAKQMLGDREPTSADLPNLPFTAQVFSEALRLYPPAWVISRKAEEADQIDGYPIPPGSLVIISPYVVHRNPQFWDQPEMFSPQRFSPAQEGSRHRFAYIPFGAGPRLCIGNQFASIEAQLIIAMIARSCWLECVSGADVRMDALVTLRPHAGMPMRVRAF